MGTTEEWVKILESVVESLRFDNERLRGLIARTESASDGFCFWCGAYRGQGEAHDHEPHGSVRTPAEDCPAFTPDGFVK